MLVELDQVVNGSATVSDPNSSQCDIGTILEVETKGGLWEALNKTATLST